MSFFPPKLPSPLSSRGSLFSLAAPAEAAWPATAGLGFSSQVYKWSFFSSMLLSLPAWLFDPQLQAWVGYSLESPFQPWLRAGLSALILLWGG